MFIGIDKTKIKGFIINSIDINKLTSNSNVVFQQKPYGLITEDINGNELRIDYLKITDGHIFNSFMLGVKLNKGVPNPYGFIEIHIDDSENGNLKPLSISEYINLIERLKHHLVDRYGLYVDFEHARFEDIEINITSKMDNPFEDYQYLLNIMAYLIPKRFKKEYINSSKNVAEVYRFFNKSKEIKIYDKTKQMQQHESFKIELDGQYMRVEYTLHKPNNIENSLGTAYIFKMKDSSIHEYLREQIMKDLIQPISKHITSSHKVLMKMALEFRRKHPKQWIDLFLLKAIGKPMDAAASCGYLVYKEQLDDILIDLIAKNNIRKALYKVENSLSDVPLIRINKDLLEEFITRFNDF